MIGYESLCSVVSMDERLFSVSLRGNVDELQRLLDEDPFILHRVASVSAETPLHLATMAGHLDFVRHIVKLMPEFTGELNQNGLSPIHLASANGYVKIVKELLMNINCDQQCRLESNRDKKTPIHYAAIKGRSNVISELISSCKECLEDVTIRGETALHLAVKNNQLEAFRVMVERLKKLNKEDILSVKDEEGNTVLHLATSMKQREVLKLLLVNDMDTSSTSVVEVNAVNRCNLTALDLLLLLLPNESTDRCIEEILRRAGAKRAEELADNVQVLISSNNQAKSSLSSQSSTTATTTTSTQSPLYCLVEFFKFRKGRDSPSDARSTLLVIAVLIATAAYQAVLSPPGGLRQDDGKKPDDPYSAGKSILSTSNQILFGWFLLWNSVGFFASLFMIKILTQGFPMRLELHICIVAMIFTYDCAMISIIPYNGVLGISFYVISILFPLGIPFVANRLRLWWIGWKASRGNLCD